MKKFKEEIENSGMSFTEGGSYTHEKHCANIPEPFFIDDKYYYSLDELKDEIVSDGCELEDLPDDYQVEIFYCELLPIIKYSPEMIADLAEDFSENNDEEEYNEIINALNKVCDFEKLNSLIPKLWHPIGGKSIITKSDLL